LNAEASRSGSSLVGRGGATLPLAAAGSRWPGRERGYARRGSEGRAAALGNAMLLWAFSCAVGKTLYNGIHCTMWAMSLEYVSIVDDRGRIVVPAEVRRRAGLRAGSRVVVRVKSGGVVEIIPLDRLLEEVAAIFEEKLKSWREEEHEASRFLEELVEGGAGDS